MWDAHLLFGTSEADATSPQPVAEGALGTQDILSSKDMGSSSTMDLDSSSTMDMGSSSTKDMGSSTTKGKFMHKVDKLDMCGKM